ncbi:integrase, catalytic region, zinc finger, CCHC-type containing protein [Tanacetum coccineum]
MTKQERKSMLYDEFDKFTYEPGESIHSYYLRYAELINDIKIIPMSMSNMQIKMKFVNHLQHEWSRFVTVAKQARDLYIVNFDQLYAFLKHNEKDAKEVREMRQRFPEPLTLLANTYNPPPSYNSPEDTITTISTLQTSTSTFIAMHLHLFNNHLYFNLIPDLLHPTFLPTDDPIASLNKAMTSQGYAGNAGKNQASGARVVNTVGNARENKPRVIKCYNCNGEGHIAKQSTTKKRDSLADSFEKTDDCDDLQLQATINFKADHVDAYDSDCDYADTSTCLRRERVVTIDPRKKSTISISS